MLNLAVRNTNKVIREKSKNENIRLGRIFTKKDAARLMAKFCEIPAKETIYVLDPGAGTGILSAAIVEKICRDMYDVTKVIYLDCYETDTAFTPMLKKSLEAIRKKCRHDYDVKLFVTIYPENYLTDAKTAEEVSELWAAALNLDICMQLTTTLWKVMMQRQVN